MLHPIKARTPVLAFVLLAFATGYTYAESKVVVIPLGADAAPNFVTSYNQITREVTVSTSDTIVNSAYIGTSASGMIIATGTVSLVESDGDTIGCALSASTSIDDKFVSFWQPPAALLLNNTLTSVNHFKVDAGLHTVNHLCYVDSATGTSKANRGNLSLLFIPD